MPATNHDAPIAWSSSSFPCICGPILTSLLRTYGARYAIESNTPYIRRCKLWHREQLPPCLLAPLSDNNCSDSIGRKEASKPRLIIWQGWLTGIKSLYDRQAPILRRDGPIYVTARHAEIHPSFRLPGHALPSIPIRKYYSDFLRT